MRTTWAKLGLHIPFTRPHLPIVYCFLSSKELVHNFAPKLWVTKQSVDVCESAFSVFAVSRATFVSTYVIHM